MKVLRRLGVAKLAFVAVTLSLGAACGDGPTKAVEDDDAPYDDDDGESQDPATDGDDDSDDDSNVDGDDQTDGDDDGNDDDEPGPDAGRRDAATDSGRGRDAGTDSGSTRPGSDAGDAAEPEPMDEPDAAAPNDGGTQPPTDAGDDEEEPADDEDECGPIPTTLTAETASRRSSSFGFVEYQARNPNQFTRLKTKLAVPTMKGPSRGTIFLWPGLQPLDGPNFQPIGNGVLQPVLTWGPTCAPGARSSSEWFISGMYVNVTSRQSDYRGCKGGPIMTTPLGDVLDLDIVLEGQNWIQTAKSARSGKSVDFTFNLRGQEQGRAIFEIELPDTAKPNEDIIFTKTVLTYAQPLTRPCTPVAQGMNDFVSKSRLSADGKRCCIDRMALRARGVAATTTP